MTDDEDEQEFEKAKAEAAIRKLKEQGDVEKVDFVVYNMPVELKNQYLSMAKLYYDNELWKVLADAFYALKEDKNSDVEDLEERLRKLEEQVHAMKAVDKHTNEAAEEDDQSFDTFGGSRQKSEEATSQDVDEAVDALEQLRGE